MSTDRQRSRRGAVARAATVLPVLALIALLAVSAPAGAASAQQPGGGIVRGRVLDGKAGTPVDGVAVTLVQGGAGEPGEAKQSVSDGDGAFEFRDVPAGIYELGFAKAGYRTSSMKSFRVVAGQVNPADFPLPPLATGGAEQEVLFEEFVVEAAEVVEAMDALELRVDSDQLLNIMGSEDFAKYSAGDVADALKWVAGVNVVEGQFAIIRGLEDRYSSTLYNSAPVPSPDPDRQSIPLDLFPAEIVNDLVVAKTFGAEMPSNSSGGAIDIVTHEYSDEPFAISLSAKGGLNDNAYDDFLQYQGGSPVGKQIDGLDVLYGEFSGSISGRTDVIEREIRYKAVANWQNDYDTAKGFQEGREPANRGASSHFPAGDLAFGELSLTSGRFDLTTSGQAERLTLYGGFGFDIDEEGDHQIDSSVFWTRTQDEVVQLRDDGYLPGFDYSVLPQLESEGQEIDFNVFDGSSPPFVPGQVASENAWIARGVRRSLSSTPETGFPWIASFYNSQSFKVRRDLLVTQVNGDHEIAQVDGLHFGWAGNYAKTSQHDRAYGAKFFFEPCGLAGRPLSCPAGVVPITQRPEPLPTQFPLDPGELGPGYYVANRGLVSSANDIDEHQYFGRVDGDYERELARWLTGEVRTGFWYEHAKRDVSSSFLDPDRASVGCTVAEGCFGGGTQYAIFADTPEELGGRIFTTALSRTDGALAGLRDTTNESKREIKAWNLGAKATFWEWLDVLAGVRLENIHIESKNDPFTDGISFDQTPLIFPTKYLLFDRLDNLVREGTQRQPPFNDEILGLDPQIGPCRDGAGAVIPDGQRGAGQCVDLINRSEIDGVVNSELDEDRALPAVGLAFRPTEWLTLRGAYSQTVARPSFREIGYYVTVEPGTDDLTIGNPQLGLSDVESFDGRVEVIHGDAGDLLAFSGFYKTIEDPIEQIILRDPAVFEASATDTFRTFFNNPSEATLWGIEIEGRKNLGFLAFDVEALELLDTLSVGGNYTYIDAQVDRSEAERVRAEIFFGDSDGTPFGDLKKSRRLYGQPEWIANADVTFDHPDWGTKATLAYFAISDVLDAAGVALPNQAGFIRSFTLDRYVGSYGQLDLILTQEIWEGLSVKFTAKNLTDSKRTILYDPEQTQQTIKEREYRVGRDYTVELKYSF